MLNCFDDLDNEIKAVAFYFKHEFLKKYWKSAEPVRI